MCVYIYIHKFPNPRIFYVAFFNGFHLVSKIILSLYCALKTAFEIKNFVPFSFGIKCFEYLAVLR